MDTIQAKEQLKRFLGDQILTFSIQTYPNGEWVATCNEISGIMTGGMGNDIRSMDSMIREAILTAAGIDGKYAEKVLKFVGLESGNTSFFSRISGGRNEIKSKEAEYVLA